MGKEACIKWASSLFSDLGSWQNRSQIEFSKIVNSHNTNIMEGMKGLIAEIHDLQNQLRITSKEKNTFIETVNNLNGEIKKLKSELITFKSLSQANANCTQDEEENMVVQEKDGSETHLQDNITESLCNLGSEDDRSLSEQDDDLGNFNQQGDNLYVSPNEHGDDSKHEKKSEEDPTDPSEFNEMRVVHFYDN